MANFVSPGVYIIEKDVSDYPATINSSVVGIVGFADRGPIAGLNGDKATLITSQEQLISTFGEPSESIKGQALEGALEILEGTNSLRFVRAADTTVAAEASSLVSMGACPAALVSGTHSSPLLGDISAIGSLDAVSSVKFSVTLTDNAGVTLIDNKEYIVPPGTLSITAAEGATTQAALKKVIGGSLDSDRLGVITDGSGGDANTWIVGLIAGEAVTLSLEMEVYDTTSAWVGANGLQALDLNGEPLTAASSASIKGWTFDTTSVAYLAESVYPGAGYNTGTKSDGSTSGISFEVGLNGASLVSTQVNNLGAAAESFKVGFITNTNFIEDVIGISTDAATSDYITGQVVSGAAYDKTFNPTSLTNFYDKAQSLGLTDIDGSSNGGAVANMNPRFVKLIQGSYQFTGGDSGIPAASTDVATAIIGTVKSDGGRTGIEALDDDVLNISIALTPGPGVGDLQAVQNALVTKAEETTNFLALVSPPYAVGKAGDAIDWSNGFATTRTAAINSSYGAIYWPWLKVFQPFDGKDRWLAPEIFAARQMGVTDAVADPWWAPAGLVRGRLTKPSDVEVTLTQGDRDSLYSGGNVINPIVNFPQNGIAIYGQRTSQREPSALDRINVRRMMIYIKKVLLLSTQRLVFEPNDRFTWERVENLVNPLLDDILRRRGITEFKVICDETVNTPVRVDRNEMWCKVLIKPTKAAEIVIFELNLTNQSAQF